ncbi:2OG-Fe(II) oxygenase family protein [Actinocrispum sp. NPDC049592]|uniref:isopenicillin N synthase family dioxygenase n=1 Tax=Actinocrispum sp. NPDC049592 TaxID=3154835 RepID=UPI0034158BCE
MTSVSDGIALIDLAGWREHRDENVARRLLEAFRDTGFAQITGHGVAETTRTAVFDAAQRLFALGDEELDIVHNRHAGHCRGHVRLDETPGPGPRYETFDLGLDLPDTYQGPGRALRTTANLWPRLDRFRSDVERYRAAVRSLADSVLSAIAVALDQPADFFLERCREPHALLRLLHYPQQPHLPEGSLSVGRHSDYEAVTVLAQDSVGGLQVRGPRGGWIDVRPVPGAFVLNAGEMLTRWTNGLLPATPHRVLSPRDQDRYSVAFFYATSFEVVIEPIGGPAANLYEPITTGSYLDRRFGEVGN